MPGCDGTWLGEGVGMVRHRECTRASAQSGYREYPRRGGKRVRVEGRGCKLLSAQTVRDRSCWRKETGELLSHAFHGLPGGEGRGARGEGRGLKARRNTKHTLGAYTPARVESHPSRRIARSCEGCPRVDPDYPGACDGRYSRVPTGRAECILLTIAYRPAPPGTRPELTGGDRSPCADKRAAGREGRPSVSFVSGYGAAGP
jgi:hypothetical protein